MIVTTGSIIRVEVSFGHDRTFGVTFERTSERPGGVTMTVRGARRECTVVELPATDAESEAIIAAYRRAIQEDVGYRKSEYEAAPRPASVAPICDPENKP